MTSWGEIPTHCPDFNDIIYCNVDKLKKMELLLQDYGEAQKQYALRIQGQCTKLLDSRSRPIMVFTQISDSHYLTIVSHIDQIYST